MKIVKPEIRRRDFLGLLGIAVVVPITLIKKPATTDNAGARFVMVRKDPNDKRWVTLYEYDENYVMVTRQQTMQMGYKLNDKA